jgi:hypothetical protein
MEYLFVIKEEEEVEEEEEKKEEEEELFVLLEELVDLVKKLMNYLLISMNFHLPYHNIYNYIMKKI